ncbi:hypothetical protein DYB28_000060 [Aphanomyces astaci]|uniref:EF-hand domain-containing protein n=1 Tax=Aphanomyces astaci TaxID=112090 RepID=A0A397CAH3_APHAT|nr:hypothetical protein DYB30_003531 [Aphanomyces astaci]RHY49842.1 hypothetical protein DYB38_009542 [Aphanomyces astaci]RHY91439.1 hypothetical protein DYB35_005803 [Aphanomyces astaci]RLO07299.1 hypothetical protein DYB28_000060 [Aphanomyces astaci]RQM24014.1 hypothetical protein B5M09_004913 [Aphanomyces astaci]
MHSILARSLRRSVRPQGASAVAKAFSTVGATLEKAVDALPHREAVRAFNNVDRDDDLRFSYQEFNNFVNELTNGFLELQFQKGDTIALWLPNNAENLVAQFAAAKAGLNIAAVDPSISTVDELAFVVKDSKAVALLFDPKNNDSDSTDVAKQVFANQPYARGLQTVITTAIDPVHGFLQFRRILVNALESHYVEQRTAQIDAAAPLVVSYTRNNGQTPIRGAALTHGDVVKLTSNDKILLTDVPAGFVVASVAAALKNSMVVLAPSALKEHAVSLETPSVATDAKAAVFQRLQ